MTAGPLGAAVLVGTLLAATLVGLLWRRANGRFAATAPKARPARTARPGHGEVPPDADAGAPATGEERTVDGERLSAADIGAELGGRATLVQFSTAFCQPCRATRRILDEVAAMVDGVAHVEIDAEDRLDLVRRLGVMRTPTVLVLDADGAVRTRASGQPRKADVIAALGTAI